VQRDRPHGVLHTVPAPARLTAPLPTLTVLGPVNCGEVIAHVATHQSPRSRVAAARCAAATQGRAVAHAHQAQRQWNCAWPVWPQCSQNEDWCRCSSARAR
jgi:hypothetical protein